MIEPLAIEHQGKPTHVLSRFTDRERVREVLDHAEDLGAVRRMESDPNRDRVPLAIVKRLLDDENLLKVWRGHRGLTQQALADVAGLPRSTVAGLGSGARKDTWRRCEAGQRARFTLDKLCRA